MTSSVRNPPLLRLFHKRIQNRSSRHPHRTLYDNDIFFLRINVTLFVCIRRITFIGSHEPRRHLHAVRTHLQIVLHILTVIDTAGHDHRNLRIMLRRRLLHLLNDLPYFFIIMKSFDIVKLFPVKTKMPAGQRSFDDHRIRQPRILFPPVAQDHLC